MVHEEVAGLADANGGVAGDAALGAEGGAGGVEADLAVPLDVELADGVGLVGVGGGAGGGREGAGDGLGRPGHGDGGRRGRCKEDQAQHRRHPLFSFRDNLIWAPIPGALLWGPETGWQGRGSPAKVGPIWAYHHPTPLFSPPK